MSVQFSMGILASILGVKAVADVPAACSGQDEIAFYQKSYENGKDFVARTERERADLASQISEYERKLQALISDRVSAHDTSMTDRYRYCAQTGVIDSIIAESRTDQTWKGVWRKTATSPVGIKPPESVSKLNTLSIVMTGGDVRIQIDPNAKEVSILPQNGDDKVKIDKKNGQITVTENVRRFSSNAKLNIIAPPTERIQLKSVNGDVVVIGSPDNLDIHATGSNVSIRYDGAARGETKIGTTSGNVVIEIPKGSHYRGRVASQKGHITGQELFAQAGDYLVQIGSVSGNVEIKAY